MPKPKRPEIWITPGDPEGVGPEVTAKALRSLPPAFFKKFTFVIVGSKSAFTGFKVPKNIFWIEPSHQTPGGQSAESVFIAAQEVLRAPAKRALVTGPISKSRIQAAGFKFPGHTEILAHVCGVKEATMMLANSKLRISLVTVHTPIQKVSKKITARTLDRCFEHTFTLVKQSNVLPTIAVLGLNPHAGEEGKLGAEEQKIIIPWMKKTQKKFRGKVLLTGPHPADTFFARDNFSDAVMAMYHDQGLIPVKMLDFYKTVNITLGLPIIRTSVDHGTAFDIAGDNKANPSSMTEAILLAAYFLNQRMKADQSK